MSLSIADTVHKSLNEDFEISDIPALKVSEVFAIIEAKYYSQFSESEKTGFKSNWFFKYLPAKGFKIYRQYTKSSKFTYLKLKPHEIQTQTDFETHSIGTQTISEDNLDIIPSGIQKRHNQEIQFENDIISETFLQEEEEEELDIIPDGVRFRHIQEVQFVKECDTYYDAEVCKPTQRPNRVLTFIRSIIDLF